MPKPPKEIALNTYTHDAKRTNNPQIGLVSNATVKLNGKTQYKHDPHIDPFLSWAGKDEGQTLTVQNVSLHIHERIDSSRIIKSFLNPKKNDQPSLFDEPENNPPLNKAIDFYKHDQSWTNRLVAGDSSLVMNSLLAKEGMAGKIQMVYFDPPYGIKYNSNFQPFVNKRDVKDGNDSDIPAEPEMIQAFRDTWELGIHSYLTYLRDRLILARELLAESGSVFVQISDENVHHVREICDEVFGKDNFIALIPFRKKTMPFGAIFLEQMNDFIIFYSKNNTKLKYRQLFKPKNVQGDQDWVWYLDNKLTTHRMSKEQQNDFTKLPNESKIFRLKSLEPSGLMTAGMFNYVFEGKEYGYPKNGYGTTPDGMKKLESSNRIQVKGNLLNYRLFLDDYPVTALDAIWQDTVGANDKTYVVQTNTEVIQRCMLMSTDPSDIVLDITCGSGTTAFVAEQWGRRWITCDTSRVALTLAKQRLMTAKFDYYQLAYPEQGIKSGFNYKTVPHITLKSIANNEPPAQETLYDQPVIEKSKVRVTGPFTVEAVPSLRVKPFDGNLPIVELADKDLGRTGETGKQTQWRDELLASGIRATGGKMIMFSRVEPMIATQFLHAKAEVLEADSINKTAYISFGPDYGPLDQRQVEAAISETMSLKEKPDFLIFAAFHFDPEASKDIDNMHLQSITVLKTQMSVDLLTADLRKKRSSTQAYWLIGQPDVSVQKNTDGTFTVTLHGFDYYNPTDGKIDSKGTKHVAMWFLDTDYDERSIMPAQVFFPEGDQKRDWTKLAKALKAEVNEDALHHFSGVTSIPFTAGTHKKIAVKIIDNRGIESFVIKGLE